VKKKRNRSRPALSLQERMKRVASLARAKADGLPPGQEHDRLIQTAVSNDAAAAIDRCLLKPENRWLVPFNSFADTRLSRTPRPRKRTSSGSRSTTIGR
jgi:hypothetical protein